MKDFSTKKHSFTKSSRIQASLKAHDNQQSPSVTKCEPYTTTHTSSRDSQTRTITSVSIQCTAGSETSTSYRNKHSRYCRPEYIEKFLLATRRYTIPANQSQLLLHTGAQFENVPTKEEFIHTPPRFEASSTSYTRDAAPIERYLSQTMEDGPWNAIGVDPSACKWEPSSSAEGHGWFENELEL